MPWFNDMGFTKTQKDANEQIEVSLDNGINFLDTAEMYPTTPRSPKTQGDTERIIGKWIKESTKRTEIVLATKITGNAAKRYQVSVRICFPLCSVFGMILQVVACTKSFGARPG